MKGTLERLRPTLVGLLALAGWAFAAAAQERGSAPAPNSSARFERLASLIAASSYLEAAAAADVLLAGSIDDAEAGALCGLALLKVGRVEAAESLLTRALRLDPANGDAHLGLGRLSGIRNDPKTALSRLRKAVAASRFFDDFGRSRLVLERRPAPK